MEGREIWMTEKYGGPRNIGLYVMENAREILSEAACRAILRDCE